jgi:hypothetical protein
MLGLSHALSGYLALTLRLCLGPLMPIQVTLPTLHLDPPKKQCLDPLAFPSSPSRHLLWVYLNDPHATSNGILTVPTRSIAHSPCPDTQISCIENFLFPM